MADGRGSWLAPLPLNQPRHEAGNSDDGTGGSRQLGVGTPIRNEGDHPVILSAARAIREKFSALE